MEAPGESDDVGKTMLLHLSFVCVMAILLLSQADSTVSQWEISSVSRDEPELFSTVKITCPCPGACGSRGGEGITTKNTDK